MEIRTKQNKQYHHETQEVNAGKDSEWKAKLTWRVEVPVSDDQPPVGAIKHPEKDIS